MAEWSALQTGKRGDSGSIPAQDKTIFGGIKSLEQYDACHFEFNSIFLNKIIFKTNYIKKIPGSMRKIHN